MCLMVGAAVERTAAGVRAVLLELSLSWVRTKMLLVPGSTCALRHSALGPVSERMMIQGKP